MIWFRTVQARPDSSSVIKNPEYDISGSSALVQQAGASVLKKVPDQIGNTATNQSNAPDNKPHLSAISTNEKQYHTRYQRDAHCKRK